MGPGSGGERREQNLPIVDPITVVDLTPQVSKQLGVQVNDFGPSWRDGNAFLAVINSIRPGNVDAAFT